MLLYLELELGVRLRVDMGVVVQALAMRHISIPITVAQLDMPMQLLEPETQFLTHGVHMPRMLIDSGSVR